MGVRLPAKIALFSFAAYSRASRVFWGRSVGRLKGLLTKCHTGEEYKRQGDSSAEGVCRKDIM